MTHIRDTKIGEGAKIGDGSPATPAETADAPTVPKPAKKAAAKKATRAKPAKKAAAKGRGKGRGK